MKIGFWLGLDAVDSIGGGGSYTNKFIRLVDNYEFDTEIDICFLTLTDKNKLHRDCINVSQIPRFIYKLVSSSKKLTNYFRILDLYVIKFKGLSRILKKTGVKIVYYCSQAECVDSNFPFISNNWDIGHRSTHSFPELVNDGEFEHRDRFYKHVLPKSLLTICESESGKMELISLTGLGAHKIRIMPIFAGGVVSLNVSDETISSYLNEISVTPLHFFYYPAQFWAHKNHIGLLKAFKEFIKHYPDFKLVLSGSDRGNKSYIIGKVNELGLTNNVVFLSFIPEEMVFALYKSAAALIMASHFGPTNMPPIEAMELGCPVICSDLGGHREILDNGALYFNSYDYFSIYNAMEDIIVNRDVWVRKIEGQKHKSLFNSQNAMRCLNNILMEAIVIRENWA